MRPEEILGISATATPEQLRAAYLDKVKQFPPDRSPEEFEKIRDAYNTLLDPRNRFRAHLDDTSFIKPITELILLNTPRRAFVGPQMWRAILDQEKPLNVKSK